MRLFVSDSAFAELRFCSLGKKGFVKDAIIYLFVNQQITPPIF